MGLKKPQDPTRTSTGLLKKPAIPQSLQVARWWWAATALATFGFAASFFANASKRPTPEAPALWSAGIALVGFGLVVSYALFRLWRGQLAGRISLTWLGVIIGLPLLTRGFRLGFFAALILVGVALLWTPGSIKYFAPQSQLARDKRRAQKLERKQHGTK